MPPSTWSDQDVRINNVSVMTTQFWIANRSWAWTTPGFRSTNYEVAYLQGTMWRPKQLAEAVRTLTFVVDCVDDNGAIPTGAANRAAQLNANLETLLGLFAVESTQITIERDVLISDGMGGTTTETLTGYAQASNPVIPEFSEDFDEYATFSIDLVFADPIWYGAANSVVVSGTTTVNNPGTNIATNLVLTFSGGGNYHLTNNTLNPAAWLDIAASGTIVVDVRAGTVMSGTTSVIGAMSKYGTRPMFQLVPGDNSLAISGGSVTIDFATPKG